MLIFFRIKFISYLKNKINIEIKNMILSNLVLFYYMNVEKFFYLVIYFLLKLGFDRVLNIEFKYFLIFC